jgi:hypothetical protein
LAAAGRLPIGPTVAGLTTGLAVTGLAATGSAVAGLAAVGVRRADSGLIQAGFAVIR